jgi:hypothetical protein
VERLGRQVRPLFAGGQEACEAVFLTGNGEGFSVTSLGELVRQCSQSFGATLFEARVFSFCCWTRLR